MMLNGCNLQPFHSINPLHSLIFGTQVQFVVTDIGASNLKKGLFFSPDPYVKFKVSPGLVGGRHRPAPHHGQHCRTEVRRNTVDPAWDRRTEFLFIAYLSDFLEVEIKDKFAKSRPTITRNLGKLKIAISQLLDSVKPQ